MTPHDTTSGSVDNLRRPTVLLDGVAHRIWKIIHHRSTAILIIEPFKPLLQRMRDALEEEEKRLVCFVGEGTETFEVRFAGKT